MGRNYTEGELHYTGRDYTEEGLHYTGKRLHGTTRKRTTREELYGRETTLHKEETIWDYMRRDYTEKTKGGLHGKKTTWDYMGLGGEETIQRRDYTERDFAGSNYTERDCMEKDYKGKGAL